VHQSGDALTINLASDLLFDSGQDQLKSGGTDALKRVGSVLKDFPEKQVHVAGYTDNIAIKVRCRRSSRPIRSSRMRVPIVPLRRCGTAA
jgi:chemotaxis protein MotB